VSAERCVSELEPAGAGHELPDVDEHQALGDLAVDAGERPGVKAFEQSRTARSKHRKPRLFEPPAPVKPEPSVHPASAEGLEAPSEPAQLFDPPLRVVEATPPDPPANDGAFFSLTVEARNLLRECFPRPGCTSVTANATYTALVELGNEKRPDKGRSLQASDWFEVYREDLAERAGVRSGRTLDPYLDAFVQVGLLDRRRRRRKPNLWRLPHARGDSRKATSDTSRDQEKQPATPQTGSRKATSDIPVKKYSAQERNVVVLSPRDERQARRARRAPALDSLVNGSQRS
jgi:hypothetical protein